MIFIETTLVLSFIIDNSSQSMLHFFHTCVSVLILLLACNNPLFSTSIIPYAHLGEGIALSETVVTARAVSTREQQDADGTYTETRFQVVTTLKGNLQPTASFYVRPYSCKLSDGGVWSVAGDFEPEAGRTYLLFLSQQHDFYRPNMLSYYVFEEKTRQGEEVLVPIAGTRDFATYARPDGIVPEPLRIYKKQAILQLLSDYGNGTVKHWNAEEAAMKYRFQPVQDRALPAGCVLASGSTLIRWQDPVITIKYDQNYTYTTPGLNINTLLSSYVLPGFSAAYTGINPVNGGLIGSGSPYAPCPLNAATTVPFQQIWLLVEDPCNAMADLSGCIGTLGLGGPVWYTPTHTYKGEAWLNIRKGRVQINNGVNCLGTIDDLKELYQHEITHTFGIGHLSPTTENMYSYCCQPINSLDMTCMNYVYDIAAPVEVSRFDVRTQGNRVAAILWETASELNSSYYSIERSIDGIDFEPLAKVPASASGKYEWVDRKAFAGVNYYRLSQTDLDGTTRQIGIKSVRFAGEGVSITLWPNPAQQKARVVITTENAIDGVLVLTAPDGRQIHEQSISMEAGRWQNDLPLEHLPAGQYRVSLTTGTGVWHQVLVKQ
jgi:hypothetical protein